jgi:hypothetical protein
MWSRMRWVRCLSKILTRFGLQVRRVLCEVYAFIVGQNDRAAVLLMKTGGMSSQTLMSFYHLSYRIFYQIVVESQRKSYRFLITPQPTVAMLHRRHV